MKDEDINFCYNMSLKDFEHSSVHDLFKVCNFTLISSLLYRNFLPSNPAFLCLSLVGHVQVHRSV